MPSLIHNAEYNVFETLWVFALIGGRWGVQFRSSFLDRVAAAEAGGKRVDS